MTPLLSAAGDAASPPKFENDIFVSYAHIDDQVIADGQTGWIATLHRALEVRLAQLLGYEPKIWRDPKLQGNDVFADKLVDRLPRVAVLISILSPRYVKSEWCLRELNEFLRATGGARVADKLRVFKVVKTPVLRAQMPPPLVPVLGYEFFTVDPQNGRERELEFNQALATPEQRRLYLLKLDDLAHDVADLLATLERDAPVAGDAAADVPTRSVYVAETSADANDRRDTIRRELQARGFTVLPDRPLPLVADECAAVVRDQLARCCLSVHIVGRNYGLVPDGARESIVVVQNELAIERASTGDFGRLIWMPPDVTVDDPRQHQFIERLESDPRNDAGTDVLKTAIEDFKSVLHVRLSPPRPAQAVATDEPLRDESAADPIKRVYVICDRRDVNDTRALEDFLFSRRCEVILPVFDGDEAQIRQDHETNLIECDAAVIYYGAGNELWLRSKLRELKKIAGYGRTRPLTARAVYVAPPSTPEKDRFRTLDAMVIAAGSAGPAALEPLLALLTSASERAAAAALRPLPLAGVAP
jgi:TIR domain-containing protein